MSYLIPPCRTGSNSTYSIFHANGLTSMSGVVQENRGMRKGCFSINVSIILDCRQILEIRNSNDDQSAHARESSKFGSCISSRDLSPGPRFGEGHRERQAVLILVWPIEWENVEYSKELSTKLWLKLLSAWDRGHLSNHHPPY